MVKRVVIHAAVALGIKISDVAVAVNVSRQRRSKVAQMPLAAEERDLLELVIAQLRMQVAKVD